MLIPRYGRRDGDRNLQPRLLAELQLCARRRIQPQAVSRARPPTQQEDESPHAHSRRQPDGPLSRLGHRVIHGQPHRPAPRLD